MVYPAVRIPAKRAQTASFIFLHGLGDSGEGWSFLAEEAARQNKLQHVKFIFPDAPNQPVSLNFGMSMPSWYDIKSLGNVQAQQDEEGILKSVDRLKEIIAEEVAAGIPTERIVIGGFSQGCAVSLSASVIFDKRLAGIVALSGYLPIKEKLKSIENTINRSTPYFLGHGTYDNVVQFSNGVLTRDYLKDNLGRVNLSWNEYKGMEHSACPEELNDIMAFTESVLPEK